MERSAVTVGFPEERAVRRPTVVAGALGELTSYRPFEATRTRFASFSARGPAGTLLLLAAIPALALARAFLPAHGLGLGVRLAAATACLLLPGALVARALRMRGAAATLVWSLAALFVALLLTFAFGRGLEATLILLLAIVVVALPTALWRTASDDPSEVGDDDPAPPSLDAVRLGVLGAGIALGVALWHVAGSVGGDGLFHLARVEKLEAFDVLSLHAVIEFKDGGLHPGYAFPLWHGFLALVAQLAGVDSTAVVLHEATVLAPLALVLAYEAGRALFGSRALGAATSLAFVTAAAVAPGDGGAYRSLALPPSAGRHLLAVAALALLFGALARPSLAAFASLAAASLALALVHPTYALFLLVPVGGFLVVRAVVARSDVRALAVGLGALALPAAAVSLWLLPLARETVSHEPAPQARLTGPHGAERYAGQIEVRSAHRFRLAPEAIARGGAVAIASLALVPLAALAGRRRWSAFVLGGSAALLAVLLIPEAFVRLADTVSLSQARRAAGFLPFAFALAGGAAVLARLLRFAVLPVALAAGFVLERAYPGDFGYTLRHGGPAAVAWLALLGGAAGVVVALLLGRRATCDRRGALAGAAVALFLLPVAIDGFSRWSPEPGERALPAGLVAALRTEVPAGAVVFSDTNTSYRIAAAAPVYVASAPPGHVADTEGNRPRERRRDAGRFFTTGRLEIPRRYGARWLVVDRQRFGLRPDLPRVYGDRRYTLYRLGPVRAQSRP